MPLIRPLLVQQEGPGMDQKPCDPQYDDMLKINITETLSVFGSVVVGVFQITFHAKIHANNVFSFFKNHF
jgi:hypothetical protein